MPQFSADAVTGGGPGRQRAGHIASEQRSPMASDDALDALNVAGGGRTFGGGGSISRDKKASKTASFAVRNRNRPNPGVNSVDRYQAQAKV